MKHQRRSHITSSSKFFQVVLDGFHRVSPMYSTQHGFSCVCVFVQAHSITGTLLYAAPEAECVVPDIDVTYFEVESILHPTRLGLQGLLQQVMRFVEFAPQTENCSICKWCVSV